MQDLVEEVNAQVSGFLLEEPEITNTDLMSYPEEVEINPEEEY